jgi:L-ascorbate metabolism protein UlaG (beta-lactamase superfamily)
MEPPGRPRHLGSVAALDVSVKEVSLPAQSADPEARVHLRKERMIAAPNFVDGRFVNPSGRRPPGGASLGVMKEFFFDGHKRVPRGALPMVSPIESWRERVRTGLRATWLGHSTTLLELDGARILTDPVWADRASPSSMVGPKRFHRPPVALDALPPLDAILVSHDHYDHLDASAVRELARLSTAPFVTALGVGAHLERFGVPHERIIELGWWERAEIPGTEVTVTASPAQHFSGRGAFDRNKTLWASYTFTGPRHRVFFSGDTGLEPELANIGRKLGPFDLVMLEVGAWNELWGDIHLGPAQAIEAHRLLGSGAFLPVHWSTFDLALHVWDEPILALEQAARDRSLPLLAPRLGQAFDVVALDELPALDAWWRSIG